MPDSLLPPLGDHLVLVVDDRQTCQVMAGLLLQRRGLATVYVDNGQEALARIEGGLRPALILIDCQMPVMDGYEATQHIRDWEAANQLPRTPIIAVTAESLPEDVQRCRDAGMDDYLAKPLHAKSFYETIERWLRAATPAPGNAISPSSE